MLARLPRGPLRMLPEAQYPYPLVVCRLQHLALATIAQLPNSGVMMLRHLGEQEAATRLEGAVARVIAEGKDVTYDMKPSRDDPTAVGTSEVADAIIEKLEAEVAV